MRYTRIVVGFPGVLGELKKATCLYLAKIKGTYWLLCKKSSNCVAELGPVQ